MTSKSLVQDNPPHLTTPTPKRRRRHTRVHIDSLRPVTVSLSPDALSECPKCQGLVNVDAGEQMGKIVVRCLNCGWQPHHQARQIQETEEAKDIRSRIAQFVTEGEWKGFPIW